VVYHFLLKFLIKKNIRDGRKRCHPMIHFFHQPDWIWSGLFFRLWFIDFSVQVHWHWQGLTDVYCCGWGFRSWICCEDLSKSYKEREREERNRLHPRRPLLADSANLKGLRASPLVLNIWPVQTKNWMMKSQNMAICALASAKKFWPRIFA